MSVFEYVTAALLLVLGLGVTRLLSDAVDAFRSRQTTRLHWIPLTWAGIVFAWQMQYIWAVFELHTLLPVWTAAEFLVMLLLALLLFIAGALVIPRASDETSDAWEQFQQDGRWTLAILATFFFVAYFANIGLFGETLLSIANLSDPFLGVLLVVTLFVRSPRVWAWMTVTFALLSLVAIVLLSPAAYG